IPCASTGLGPLARRSRVRRASIAPSTTASSQEPSMPLPPLPTNKSDTWDMGPAFEKKGRIASVSAHAGRVLVGGEDLYQLKAGDQNWQWRELPDSIGGVSKVAQEPRAPFRQAVSSGPGV